MQNKTAANVIVRARHGAVGKPRLLLLVSATVKMPRDGAAKVALGKRLLPGLVTENEADWLHFRWKRQTPPGP